MVWWLFITKRHCYHISVIVVLWHCSVVEPVIIGEFCAETFRVTASIERVNFLMEFDKSPTPPPRRMFN